jgi:UDP-N-acetyl-D-mannosaminuronic acid dehydrogenase
VPADDDLGRLKRAIEDRSATVGVIGLGYVGLPVACAFADAGFDVIGVDIDDSRVGIIRSGQSPMKGAEPGLDELLARVVADGKLRVTTGYQALTDAAVVTLNVETPVDDDNVPQYAALRAAATSLGAVMGRGTLVIVESTVSPGTTLRTVAPLLEEESGLTEGDDFFVGACPERVMPGKLLANLRNVGRVCGGSTGDVAHVMRRFYETVVAAEIDTTDVSTAELVKVTENAYRDVQIAFANEVALICEDQEIDVWQVRDLVNKVPFRHMHEPGAGVGGHCIPKDPWLLAAAVRSGTPLRLIPAARAVNDSMPGHVADVALERVGLDRETSGGDRSSPISVAVLGYAYLPGSDDTRNSPSEALVRDLESRGVDIRIHDPYVEAFMGPIEPVIDGVDAVIVMVNHDEYADLDIAGNVIDARHLLAGRLDLIGESP